MSHPSLAASSYPRLFGRHVGKTLRPRQKQLLTDLLPALTVQLTELRQQGLSALEFKQNSLALEIGFGGGEHLAAQAHSHKDRGFIGCEHFQNGIARLLGFIADEEKPLENIRIFPNDARQLLDCLPEASLDQAYLLFPDPWPKKRHFERRFIQVQTLDQLERVLKPGAVLRMASDMPFLVDWMQEHCLAHKSFCPAEQTDQGRYSERPSLETAPMTRYEQKAIAAGRVGVYLDFIRS